MERIDRLYLAHPENGSRMMVRVLARAGISVNRLIKARKLILHGILLRPIVVKTIRKR